MPFSAIPASFARYQSEYHFLFDVIHRFHKAPDKTAHDVLILLPNAMRRIIDALQVLQASWSKRL